MNTGIQALTLFNERVDRLARSALAIRMADPHYTIDYEKMMKREWISADGLTEDTIDAFVCNIRLLVQDRDGFSIRCLAEDVYIQDTVPKDLQSRFAEQRQKWHEHRNRRSLFKSFLEDRNFNNGELFDVLMYGGLVHANRDKVSLFRVLTKQGAYSSFVFASFLSSLRVCLDVVRAIRDINVELVSLWEC